MLSFRRIGTHAMRTGGSSTDITKLLPTFTGHSRTTFCSFNPIIALRTLLKLGPSDKLNKISIIFTESVVDLIFSTGHSSVIETFTFEAIVLATSRTTIVI